MSQDQNNKGSYGEPQEEMRLCPTCRMKVSVWATKCHHCGEEVGRPRREEMKLTLKDLGGESKTSYAPSGNVTGALESFRVEEASSVEAMLASRRKVSFLDRLLGRTPPPPPPKRSAHVAQDLDEYSRNLAASLLDDMPSSSSVSISRAQLPQSSSAGLAGRIRPIVMVIGALVLLYFGGNFAWGKISEFIDARNRANQVVYTNRALEMLAAQEDSIVAFEEAMTALRVNDTDANRQIAADVRSVLLKDVDSLMAANPWRRADQDKAYEMMQRAMKVDSAPEIRTKYESVAREIGQFKFVLKSVDSDGKKATFRLNNPDYEQEVTVGQSDRIMDRFIVAAISSSEVHLNDDRVSGRRLAIGINEGVRSAY
ncbi:MAG: hypothetical protein JNK74_10190 [Candidatus Hydrogenedentes bacterium]|nr:hypothetical protein [Candidatus Hydrogenedentota bacterium]